MLSLATSGAAEPFVRGDCNGDGRRGCDISDPIYLLLHLFSGAEAPPCLEACNANDDASIDLSDAVYTLTYCFQGGDVLPEPYPDCGEDPTPGLDCAGFTACRTPSCEAQDARGVGACAAIVGIFWDGSRCRWQSGCSCEGADCDSGYESLEECYAARAPCPSVCDPMDAEGVGLCKMLLGFTWDGRRCRPLGGCECAGEDCGSLFPSEDACVSAVIGCPPECSPMDARPEGDCERVLGWAWTGAETGCVGFSGCDCVGSECAGLFAGPDECEQAHAGCRR